MFSLIYFDSRDIRKWEKLAHTIFQFFETPYYSYEKERQIPIANKKIKTQQYK
jgi:hypothetical protein